MPVEVSVLPEKSAALILGQHLLPAIIDADAQFYTCERMHSPDSSHAYPSTHNRACKPYHLLLAAGW